MTDQHPITPPPELVMKWWDDGPIGDHIGLARYMADQASRWGADQELEACCEWLCTVNRWKTVADGLRSVRRPKSQSLKEQALEVLNEIESGKHGWLRVFDKLNTIRRALEQLDD